MSGARRLLLRPWRSATRRALILLCLLLPLQVTSPAVAQEISAAEYASPTRAYPHGALGDDLEWAVLRITVSRKKGSDGELFSGHLDLSYDIKAPPQMVFEDTTPRLWDVDGDGSPEVVVVISHQDQGAQLAVLAYADAGFSYIAVTPPIGHRFRWLAPVGAADLDGDGHIELAYVETPHLSKTLKIWRFKDGEFRLVAEKRGLTNHRIGWDHIPGGVRDCEGSPELITVNENWSQIMASQLVDTSIHSRVIGAYRGIDSLNAAMKCP